MKGTIRKRGMGADGRPMRSLDPLSEPRRVGTTAGLSAALLVGCLLALFSGVAFAQSGRGHQVYAYTLKHQPVREAVTLVRPYLSAAGTVEEQSRANTLVIRDTRTALARIRRVLESFDRPPQDLRFDIQIIRAGPKRQVVSPPTDEPQTAGLPDEVVKRLRDLLRYDDYRVLAEAAVTSKEGQEVTYSLGQSYSVSFRLGSVLGGSALPSSSTSRPERLKLQDFRILRHVSNSANKGRQLEPRELFHATLNLWIDRPLNLVLAQDESSQEALMISISCRRETEETED